MSPRAFLLFGGWPGHSPYDAGEFGRELLEQIGFAVDSTMDTYRLADDLTDYDLILLAWTQSLLTEGLTVEQEDGLISAVEGGVGLAGWHGMTASFRASIRYHHLIGGTFVAHPGDLISYRVRITDRSTAITDQVNDFELVSEQYYMHVDPANHVLAETTFSGDTMHWIEGVTMPVAWTRMWGAGRVFYCTIGHTPQELRMPDVTRLISQGARWASRHPDLLAT